jgi:hypothetical protein
MGKRGRGVTGILPEPAFAAEVVAGFNEHAKKRPWSLSQANDVAYPSQIAPWSRDGQGRPRTFSTRRALLDAVGKSASGPARVRFPGEDQDRYA